MSQSAANDVEVPTDIVSQVASVATWEIFFRLALRCHHTAQFRLRSMSTTDHYFIVQRERAPAGGCRVAAWFHPRGEILFSNGAPSLVDYVTHFFAAPSRDDVVADIASRLGWRVGPPQLSRTVLSIGACSALAAAAVGQGVLLPVCAWRDASPQMFDGDSVAPWVDAWACVRKHAAQRKATTLDRYWLVNSPRPFVLDVSAARAFFDPADDMGLDLWAVSGAGEEYSRAVLLLLDMTKLVRSPLECS